LLRTRSKRPATATNGNGVALRPRASKWLEGIPEFEASKGNCRNLTHADAVEECADLSALYREMWRNDDMKISLAKIFRALRRNNVPFVLTGAHGISGWMGRPRSTHDVDILVKAGRNYVRAVQAIQALYPKLEARRFAGITAFFVPGETESVIDVAYPHRPDNEATLRTAIWVKKGSERYRIPTLEAALANKYGAMLSLRRDPGKRAQDAVDFHTMVKHSLDRRRKPINLRRLAALGEKVWPGGGGAEILRLVEQVKAGEAPNLNML
jgi:hypothetical protein